MWELTLLTTIVLGACYTQWSNGRSYDKGIVDAIKMHNDGRLSYKSYKEDDIEMLDITIEPEEWYED